MPFPFSCLPTPRSRARTRELPPAYEYLTLFLGGLILVPFGPFVAWQVFWCTVWELVDKKTLGFINMCSRLSDYAGPVFGKLTRHPKDGFVVLLLIYLGVFMPTLFFYEMKKTAEEGFR